MQFPSSIVQLALFVIALLPGMTYAAVKEYCVGAREVENDAPSRVLKAIYVSLVFSVVYAVVGLLLVGGELKTAPQRAFDGISGWNGWAQGAALLIAVIGLPGLIALIRYKGLEPQRKAPWIRLRRLGYTNEPRAWEGAAAYADTERFVRVLLPDGSYVGGWYGNASRMGLYPIGRDLFLEHQWNMNPDGSFHSPVENGRGLWIAVSDSVVVEWMDNPEDPERSDE